MWLEFDGGQVDMDVFALALGKTVVLAHNFEANCKWVAANQMFASRRTAESPGIFGDMQFEELKKFLMGPRPLGRQIKALRSATSDQLEVLDKGRKARNYVVHEAGRAVIQPVEDTRDFIGYRHQVRHLLSSAEAIAEADYIVAHWRYSLAKSRDPAINTHVPKDYSRLCVRWIAAGLADGPMLSMDRQ